MLVLVNKEEWVEKCMFGAGSACKIRDQGNLSEELKQARQEGKKTNQQTTTQRNPTKTKNYPASPQNNFLLNRSIFFVSLANLSLSMSLCHVFPHSS